MKDSDLRRLIQPDHGLSEDRHDALKEQLMATIVTDQPTADTNPAPVHINKRRRGKIVIGAAVAVLAVGGAAAAGSLFPDDAGVILPIGDCRTESSIQEVVATMQRPNGNTLQLFTTRANPEVPVNGHALIETSPDGQNLGGFGGCNPPGSSDGNGDLWANAPSVSGADGVFVWLIGKAPTPATRVEIDLSDGDTVYLDLQTDGYFVGELIRPGVDLPDESAPPAPLPRRIRAFDADGNLVQEQTQ
jgi:hypothetical protein